MTINKFTGKTKEEAIECAKQAFGPNAVIMNIKEIKPKGLFGIFKSSTYEVTAAMDEKKQTQTITTSQLARTTLPGKIDYKADEEIKMPSFAPKSASETLKPTPAPAAPKAAEQTSDIEQEIKELDSIAKMMESTFDKPQNKEPSKPQSAQELKFVRILYKTLLDNEVDEKYINQILDEIEKFLRPGNSLDVILSNVYQKLILRFGQPETIKVNGKKPRVVFFVGPTGVGKTTTIAKIASKFKVNYNKNIAFITADTYRIAATDQLRTFANILDTPLSVIYTATELNSAVAEYEQADVIFVDTAGFSHKNETQRNDMRALLAGLSPEYEKSVYLVLSATTKYRDLISIIDSYKDIDDYKLIFTKLDETSSYGNLLNIKLYSDAGISYVTNGQNVPDDIEVFDTQDCQTITRRQTIMDQAQQLRNVIKQRNQNYIEPARVITITSGKGGVGKSNTSVNLAVWLSRLGKRVIIFDADFGLANVEVMFGVIPKYTLADVIYENQTIKSIISNGPLGIDFISAGSSVVGLNNLNHKQIHFIVSAINELNSMYDFIIIDTGAGVSEQVMEFVAASNEIVLVTTPEPTSITDSYSLLKALYKRPDFDPSKVCIRVISNRAASKEDGSIVFNKINSVVMQFLNGSLEYLGYVPSDAMVEKAVRQQKILSIYDPTSKAARSFEEIAKRLLDNESAALDEKRTISHVFSNFFNRKQ